MELKARLITDDIDKIKLQQKDLSKAITMRETEQNECMQLAEKTKDLNYVIKGNTLKEVIKGNTLKEKVNKQSKNLPLCKKRSRNLK